jgi:hypothetical protein
MVASARWSNDIPKDAYTTAGNQRDSIVVPSHDLVIVRRGLIMAQGFNEWIWQGNIEIIPLLDYSCIIKNIAFEIIKSMQSLKVRIQMNGIKITAATPYILLVLAYLRKSSRIFYLVCISKFVANHATNLIQSRLWLVKKRQLKKYFTAFYFLVEML